MSQFRGTLRDAVSRFFSCTQAKQVLHSLTPAYQRQCLETLVCSENGSANTPIESNQTSSSGCLSCSDICPVFSANCSSGQNS